MLISGTLDIPDVFNFILCKTLINRIMNISDGMYLILIIQNIN